MQEKKITQNYTPIVIGLTGGIGSGKSSVCSFFKSDGVPVYDSDSRAKLLMTNNQKVKESMLNAFGNETYTDVGLNRSYLANLVFNDRLALEKINAIVHPAVAEDFNDWLNAQSHRFVVKEAAILFESGAYKYCDQILLVTADEQLRIERVMRRDKISKAQVLERMSKQWKEEDKILLSDWIIYNNSRQSKLKEDYDNIYKKIIQILH